MVEVAEIEKSPSDPREIDQKPNWFNVRLFYQAIPQEPISFCYIF